MCNLNKECFIETKLYAVETTLCGATLGSLNPVHGLQYELSEVRPHALRHLKNVSQFLFLPLSLARQKWHAGGTDIRRRLIDLGGGDSTCLQVFRTASQPAD
jgi:hypothetical protein